MSRLMPARSTGERSRETRHEPKVGDRKRGEEEEQKEKEEARGKERRRRSARRSVRAGERGDSGQRGEEVQGYKLMKWRGMWNSGRVIKR